MIYYAGPESYRNRLERVYNSISGRFMEIGSLVNERSDKLDNAFGHFMTLVVQPLRRDFPVLSIFVDSEGRGFCGLSNSSPFETASALYRFGKEEAEELMEAFKDFFGDTELTFQRAIFQTPLKLYFLSYYGNERLLKREILKDSLRGKEYFRLPEVVDGELIDICIKNYRRWLDFPSGEVFIFPVQNVLKIAFGLPKAERNIDKSVVMELSRLFRSEVTRKHGVLRSASVTPDMRIDRPVATVFEIDLVQAREILPALPHLYEFYCGCVERTLKSMIDQIENDFPLKKRGG